ncbi:MAG: metallophosphoesterase [Spirochaetes bacterium]|nr:metallophosphoesterase [Spirochaetota bacterium]
MKKILTGSEHLINKRKILFIFRISLLTLLLALNVISCSGRIKPEPAKEPLYKHDDYLIIWAHSDIQPRNEQERKYYETAIADINKNFSKVDIALVAGDIVHWSKSDKDFEWYLNTKKKTSIKHWFEIAGNHDHKNKNNYERYIQMPLHYSVAIGNIIIICLSDETRSAETNISDKAFNFWKDIVINNQDKIIITMTHGYLKQSGLFGSGIMPSRNIKNSERFADVLKKYKVDLWICGHTHLSHSFNGTVKKADDLNGTLFINVSAIRKSKLTTTESYLLFIKKDTDELIAKSRDHDNKKFNLDDIKLKLSSKFQWDNSPPVMRKMNNEKLLIDRSKQ